ncbi:diaminopimelate epimerase [Bryobacterales bacterium F-183]|nr:diaminopimelate epimerase [Bryobacterales bacterium F-183]
MLQIPFVKAHGAKNDFLLTWSHDLPSTRIDMRAAARAICHRNTGIGADGWLIVSKSDLDDGAIRLYNADGSDSEISGNGTRCAAALLIESGVAKGPQVKILTGAGIKHLELKNRDENTFLFEMNMGAATIEQLHHSLPLRRDVGPVTILNVGNPQCVVFVNPEDQFPNDWETIGAEIERHQYFPNRTNVSFVRPTGSDTLDVLFFERGVGVTQSSGTGSTGAAAAAVARGLVRSPVSVETPAGTLKLSWKADDIYLTGPAEIIGRGEYSLQIA